jgi:hypothetical protein
MVVKLGSKGHKEAFTSLADARRVGLGQGSKIRGATSRAIPTAMRAAFIGGLEGIAPHEMYNNTSIRCRRRLRGAMHAEEIEVVQLFVFGSMPFRPCAELAKFALCVFSNLVFSWSSCIGLDEVNEEINIIDGEVVNVVVVNKHGVDGAKVLW